MGTLLQIGPWVFPWPTTFALQRHISRTIGIVVMVFLLHLGISVTPISLSVY
uniref:Uncharacterized protein n=1 Tax=Lotus japonicus TaxID=34305 RepID=I3T1C8_LOTJA|nr:unknown [Lotus japonicus]